MRVYCNQKLTVLPDCDRITKIRVRRCDRNPDISDVWQLVITILIFLSNRFIVLDAHT